MGMGMFRFWSSDPRGSDKAPEDGPPMLDCAKPLHPIEPNGHARSPLVASRPLKRRKAFDGPPPPLDAPQKRRKTDAVAPSLPKAAPPEGRAAGTDGKTDMETSARAARQLDRARDTIGFHFHLEILMKHNELRLIDQEVAKCQVALEQLRRCHLIPYPTNCPTPAQMLEIADGKGPVIYRNPGERVPQWAAPFGVVDGPYARHYARWLIPDPKFDGMLPEFQVPADARLRAAIDGRSSRNLADGGSKGRAGRGTNGQRHQALPSGYGTTTKGTSGPCVLKRSDGKMVKLVCLTCNRENFSSTQGFINHCRIAHRKEYKSHDEAAMDCGQPIETDENGGIVATVDDKLAGGAVPGLAHPLTRNDTDGVYATLLGRIKATIDEYYGGQAPSSGHEAPQASKDAAKKQTKQKPASLFVGATETPNLTAFLQTKSLGMNLKEAVADATKKEDMDYMSTSDDSDSESPTPNGLGPFTANGQGVVRVPARAAMSPAMLAGGARPPSSKGRSPQVGFSMPQPLGELVSSTSQATTLHEEDEESRNGSSSSSSDDDDDMAMDVDLSPNTLVSNNAPSLVSDDGEYSDDATSESESEASDNDVEAESVSDVAEINMDEDHPHEPHRSLRHHHHHRGPTGAATAAAGVRLKREDAKHVTFVSPIKDAGTTRRRVRRI